MRYFSHDTTAAVDDKIISLRMQFGGAAVDAYWTIIERLYKDEKPLPFGQNRVETKSVCHWLCVGFDELSSWVSEMLSSGLLINESDDPDEILLWSERVRKAISEIDKRTETARQNGKKGGRPPKEKPKETQPVFSETDPKATKTKTKTIYTGSNEPVSPIAPTAKPPTVPQETVAAIVSHLNAKTGKAFQATSTKTRRLVQARVNEGFALDDFRRVIDNKVDDWGEDPAMSKYLRPETLFGTKFEGYLNESPGRKGSDRFDKYSD